MLQWYESNKKQETKLKNRTCVNSTRLDVMKSVAVLALHIPRGEFLEYHVRALRIRYNI